MDSQIESEFDQPPYQMPPFKGRNILIFSDGTGQAGGITFDEYRSNVYKLYRATRCGPDSDIDPDQQLAFLRPRPRLAAVGGRASVSASCASSTI